jgi:hypothetical protein
MKRVTTVDSQLEAEYIISLLDSYQIKSYSSSRGAGGYFNIIFNASSFGEDIQVSDEDFDSASDIIMEYQKNASKEIKLQPEMQRWKLMRQYFAIVVLLLFFAYMAFTMIQAIFL